MPCSDLYSPLDATQQHIRLLRVTSLSGERIISGSLQVVDLKTAPDYVALSYAWGSESDLQCVQIDGHTLQIRRNLFDFLAVVVIQPAHERPLIWVDQISINQNSVTERNHQVKIMDAIYRRARETWAWLGKDPHEGLAFAFIENKTPEILFHCHSVADYERAFGSSDSHQSMLFRFDSDGIGDTDQEALRTLLMSPYFGRHWIAQEIVLSKRCILHYGTKTLPWTVLMLLSCNVIFTQYSVGLPNESSLVNLSWFQYALSDGSSISFQWHNAMQYAASSVCQDPRDKVFGLQGLFPKHQRVDVDYTRSVRDIYLDFLEVWFDLTRSYGKFLDACLHLAIAMKLVRPYDSSYAEMLWQMFLSVAQTRYLALSSWPQFKAYLEKQVLSED